MQLIDIAGEYLLGYAFDYCSIELALEFLLHDAAQLGVVLLWQEVAVYCYLLQPSHSLDQQAFVKLTLQYSLSEALNLLFCFFQRLLIYQSQLLSLPDGLQPLQDIRCLRQLLSRCCYELEHRLMLAILLHRCLLPMSAISVLLLGLLCLALIDGTAGGNGRPIGQRQHHFSGKLEGSSQH